MINIHPNFKNMLLNISEENRKKYGLDKLHERPNEQILEGLKLVMKGPIRNKELMSEGNGQYYCSHIANDITAIDDEFIRTKLGYLFRWYGLDIIINQHLVLAEDDIFEVGTIVKVVSVMKMRLLNLSSSLRELIGKHYKVISNDVTTMPEITVSYPSKNILVQDAYGAIVALPQKVFEATNVIDLDAEEEKIQRTKITLQLKDSKKYLTRDLEARYSESLRNFMEVSRLLEENITTSIDEQVDIILNNNKNFKAKLTVNPQIVDALFLPGEAITIVTNPIYIDQQETQPVGRYKILINLKQFDVRVTNLDLSSSRTQHPHVSGSGQCCFGGRLEPLRKCYATQDYYQLVLGMIAFLEHYSADNPYISLENFISQNKRYFKYSEDVKGVFVPKPKVTRAKRSTSSHVVTDEDIEITTNDISTVTLEVGDEVITHGQTDLYPEGTLCIVMDNATGGSGRIGVRSPTIPGRGRGNNFRYHRSSLEFIRRPSTVEVSTIASTNLTPDGAPIYTVSGGSELTYTTIPSHDGLPY